MTDKEKLKAIKKKQFPSVDELFWLIRQAEENSENNHIIEEYRQLEFDYRKEIVGLKADKETLANSLVIESNRANGLNKENESLKKEVAYLRRELKERGY